MKTCNWVRYAAALAVIWAISISNSTVMGEDAAADKAASPGTDAATAKKPAGKDPTTSAFALPGGVKLNTKQQAAYDQLKADKQPELKQAIDDLQNSKSGATAQAAKKVRDLRTEIRNSINDIVYAPSSPSSSGRDSGSSSDSRPQRLWLRVVPYGGYYPYRPYYGGYYPYLTIRDRATAKFPRERGNSNSRKLPPRPQASRPAASSTASNGAQR